LEVYLTSELYSELPNPNRTGALRNVRILFLNSQTQTGLELYLTLGFYSELLAKKKKDSISELPNPKLYLTSEFYSELPNPNPNTGSP
jgi:hypothetical protein